ncbi:phage tail tape measure protein [Enterobacter chengduensis]|uniref:phage tail tape measure protein n=1 Tax=Enterobacter chengduensis TaxID=2494701 RepID=UPI002928AC95|nr:phage tail tape measure protein [Enterobacter chengduensis]MDV0366393.1 phage tail tape measure protein [Enterobacter chengduensis]
MATLRELIIKISANSQSFQTEIQRASRLGQNYYKTMQDGGRKASSATRETQQALAAVSSQLSETKRAATGLAGAFAGAFATGHLITLADEWNSVNARLKQASTSTEDFSNSQRALMEISQKTGTAFSDNAGLFARSSASMREFGYSSAEVLKVTEAVSTGLKLSGASTAEASSVITQLSQALAQGVLRGEEFNSVNENGDRIIRALAAGMGVARKDLKAMADQGLLTIDKVVPAITSQLQAMQGEFEAMPKTVSGSFQKVENSFMQWVGGANDAYGASATLAGGLESLADNIDTVATAAGVLTAVGVSRYFGNWTQQLKTQTEQLIAARTEEISLTAAKIEGANASLAQIAADKAMLVTNQQSMVAQLELATTEKQRTAIRGLLAKNSADLVNINRSEIATVNALAAANQRLNAMTSITRTAWAGVSSLFGGIPGILMLGAGAWYAWYQNQEQARQSAIQYASTLDSVVEKAKEMSEIQLRGSISDSGASIDALKDKLEDLRAKQDEAAASIAEYTKLARQLGVEHDQNNGYVRNAAKAQREYNQISRDIADTTAQLNKVVESQNKLQDELANKVSVSGAAFRKIQQDIQNAININDAMAASMSVTIQFMDEMRKKSGGVTGQPEINNSAYDKFIKQQNESIALSQREGVERAKLKALQDAIRQGAIRTDNSGAVLPGQEKQIAAIQSNAATDFNLLESQKKPRGKTDEQKTEDVYTRLIKQQKEQIALAGQNTELAKVKFQVSQGELASLTEAQKKTALQNAALIDQVKLREQLRNYEANLADSNASARAANEAQLIGYGQGTRFRERMQEQFNIRKEFEQKNTDLLRQRQADQINETVYQQELALNKRYLEERLRDQEGYYAASDAQRDDWMTGLSEGYANWVDEATDYSSMAADGMKQAMGGAVTTITDMLNGNVDSWKDWGVSVLKIIENVAINMAIAKGVSSFGSFFSFGASSAAAASSGTAIQNAGANFTFNAKGNVYDSPSLSAYSNGVFQTPQLFAFAKGAGVFAEAGPEAIMPLTRAADGSLGVRAMGVPQNVGGNNVYAPVTINSQGTQQPAGNQQALAKAYQQAIEAGVKKEIDIQTQPGGYLWRLIKGV